MKRDPSLHILRSDLITVLKVTFPEKRPVELMNLADTIFMNAQPYQLRDRYLKVDAVAKSVRKKIDKSVDADTDVPHKNVERFNQFLTAARMGANEYGKVRVVRKDSPDYLMLKEVAKMAYQFTTHFDIKPVDDGLKEYIRIGLKLMSKYGLNRFKYYDSKIYSAFEATVDVINDVNADLTKEFYSIWQMVMLEHTGMEELGYLHDDDAKYVHMVYARRDADKHKADYEQWIRAQFEGLAFMSVLPEIYQLYGDGARTRYERSLKKVSAPEKEAGAESGSLLDYYKNNDEDE